MATRNSCLKPLLSSPGDEFGDREAREGQNGQIHPSIELPPSPPLPPVTSDLADLIGVFVVTFDPKEGNLLEWCVPQEVSLEGIEFHALISGAHTVTSDFIYFRQGDYYGAACYEKLELHSELERGVRMKSVGVIVASYCLLRHHLPFLAQHVRKVVESPGKYSALEEYYQARRAMVPSSWDALPRLPAGSPMPMPQGSVAHPHELLPQPGTLQWGMGEEEEEVPRQLLEALGQQLVALWRASLLCKRILLFSAPPIGRVCWRVHCISLLSAHSTPGLPAHLLRPLFYISIADMDLLLEQHAYVACTTEKIFEEKTGIYDVYVEGCGIRVAAALQHTLLTVTPEDRCRLAALQSQSPSLTMASFRAFFEEVNNRIFSTMYSVCGEGGGAEIGEEQMVAMGLNPKEDRAFVRELAAAHGFDLTVSRGPCGCGPCCCCS